MSRKPDFIMKALNTETGEKPQRIGVAWQNEDGSIRIILNRFVVLPTDPKWCYSLFPVKDQGPESP